MGKTCEMWGFETHGRTVSLPSFCFRFKAMNQPLFPAPPPTPFPPSLHFLSHACILCTQYYPNISLFCRQETRSPFFLGPFRKSSRVIMAHYLMVRVYLGFHYFHCPLETRENISPIAVSVLFRADHRGDSAPTRSHPEPRLAKPGLPTHTALHVHACSF